MGSMKDITFSEFMKDTGLHDDIAWQAWKDFLNQDNPFWQWWAENQGKYV